MGKKYTITGIKPPGKINVLVAGKFRDVDLFEAQDAILEELYKNKNPHVILSEAEFLKQNKGSKKIEITEIKANRKKS